MADTQYAARTAIALAIVGFAVAAASCERPLESRLSPCENPHDADALFLLGTKHGDIAIALDEEAAPLSVRVVKNLICFGTAEPTTGAASVAKGYYDNLVIDYTQPHVEIRLSEGKGHDGIQIPKEINANSIGLDKQVVMNRGEAMDMYQFVVYEEFVNDKNSSEHSQQLREWISEFGKNNDPGFLIGTSRKEINSALGYPYIETVKSQPIRRGSVLLQPSSKTHSSPRIVIALTTLDDYVGKWTVIGEVVDGIDVVESISKMPNSGRKAPRWKPVEPVEITRADLVPDNYKHTE